MFDPDEQQPDRGRQDSPAPRTNERLGLPFDPRRLSYALRRGRWWLIGLTLVGALVGAVVGKFVLKKRYSASATVLWEPPVEARADAMRELSTLAQSVKLPANLSVVRSRLTLSSRLEDLAQRIEVVLGANSMLITVTAKAETGEEAAQLANATVEAFLEAQKDVSARRLQEVAQALRQSLVQAEKELTGSRSSYDAFRTKNRIGDLEVEVQSAIKEVARLRVAAYDAKVELEALKAQENSLRASRDASPKTVIASRDEQRPDMARLAEAEAELAKARATFTPDHPKVLALEAQVEALRKRTAEAGPAVTSQIVARSSVRDTLTTQVEELAAVRKSIEQRSSSLEEVAGQAESRAAKLTGVEAEAARLLANVQVAESHVNVLLKQIASAEDDVRGASSGFQVVSEAMPPAFAERSLTRPVAAGVPVGVLFLVAMILISREAWRLRARSSTELAYWARAPVLWSTAWPGGDKRERSDLSREVADALESVQGVVGIVGWDDKVSNLEFAELVLARLEHRGVACCIVDERDPRPSDPDLSRADAMETQRVGDAVQSAQADSKLVLLVLPPWSDLPSVRAAKRWVDVFLFLVPSEQASFLELMTLRKALNVGDRALALLLTGAPAWLLSPSSRAYVPEGGGLETRMR